MSASETRGLSERLINGPVQVTVFGFCARLEPATTKYNTATAITLRILLSPTSNRQRLILYFASAYSPPKHAGEPRDLADRGWHAGPQYRDVAALFKQARERLNPGGCLYVMLSSDSDLGLLGRLINKAGFRTRIAYERSFYIESMILYELRI
jgi:hypothetical protein